MSRIGSWALLCGRLGANKDSSSGFKTEVASLLSRSRPSVLLLSSKTMLRLEHQLCMARLLLGWTSSVSSPSLPLLRCSPQLSSLFPASESLSMLLQKPIVPSWEEEASSFFCFYATTCFYGMPSFLLLTSIKILPTAWQVFFCAKCICLSDGGYRKASSNSNVAINHRQEDQALQVTLSLYPILFYYCAKLSLLSLVRYVQRKH